MLLTTTVGVMSGASSFQNMWSMMNEFQLYQTILLLGVYVPIDLVLFWSELSFSICNLSFLSHLGVPNPIEFLNGYFKFHQPNFAFQVIGLESGSTFVNQSYLISVFIGIGFLNIIFLP